MYESQHGRAGSGPLELSMVLFCGFSVFEGLIARLEDNDGPTVTLSG